MPDDVVNRAVSGQSHTARSMSAGGAGAAGPVTLNVNVAGMSVRDDGDIERIARRLRDLTMDGLARRGIRYGV